MASDLFKRDEHSDFKRGHCNGNIANAFIHGTWTEAWLRVDSVGAYRLQRAVRDFMHNAAVNGVG